VKIDISATFISVSLTVLCVVATATWTVSEHTANLKLEKDLAIFQNNFNAERTSRVETQNYIFKTLDELNESTKENFNRMDAKLDKLNEKMEVYRENDEDKK
jgi:uncharacterized protein YyaL (SSP411 family)